MAKKLQICIDALLQLITAKAKFRIVMSEVEHDKESKEFEIWQNLAEKAEAEYKNAIAGFLQTL